MKFGVTERGDAGVEFSWCNKLLDGNLIISKRLKDNLNNPALITALVEHKEKIIFHITCTGYGGSVLEPNVPTYKETHEYVHELIESGFPIAQIVLRLDPIIPTEKGINTAEKVLKEFLDLNKLGLKRVRYSFLDLYPHVKERFLKANLYLPYETFTAPKEMQNMALNMLKKYENFYEFEACAEYTSHQLGCISQKDIDILGMKEKVEEGIGFQRKACRCIAQKAELLNGEVKCPNDCLYCYWKDSFWK